MTLEQSLFTDEEMTPLIKSISYSQESILQSIIYLHIPAGRIQVDPCYCEGTFYKSGKIPEPEYIFDIEPRYPWIPEGDSRMLPFSIHYVDSIIFDPPWITYPGKNISPKLKKYGSFKTYKDLKKMYWESFAEFHRVLKLGGILIVKCQDGTFGPDLTLYHIDDVILPCREIGFKEIDFFILLSKGRIENRNGKQRHARKYHSYFIVFKKIKNWEI